VKSRAEIRKRLEAEFLIVADVPLKQGRPKHSVIGTERKQIDILVGVQIFNALLEEYAKHGIIPDPAMEMELTTAGKRIFVSSILSKMSRVKPVVVPESPIQSLYKSLGPLVRMRKHKPVKRGEGGKFAYVARDSADRMSLEAGFAAHRIETQSRVNAAAAKTDVWVPALEILPAGLTLMEAYAREASGQLKSGD
jgi:hypothetical protein